MLEVADYRADGPKLSVRLKCSCGGRRVVKSEEKGEEVYTCAQCGAKAFLRDLKNNATTYWQGRIWEVMAEAPKKEDVHIDVFYPALLSARTHKLAAPLCELSGNVVRLSPSGLLFVAQDFRASYFEGMSSKHRVAAVSFLNPVKGLPPKLHGTIVEIRFREEELPLCNIRVAFDDILTAEKDTIAAHVRDLRGRITEWSAQ